MKVIHAAPLKCPCLEKLGDFASEHRNLGHGSIVECDCGTQYKLGKLTWIAVKWPEVGQ